MFGIGNGVARELEVPSIEVTVEQILAGNLPPTSTASRRSLRLAGQVVATLPADTAKLTSISARSAEGMPVAEMLAAMAASHPSGLLILDEMSRSEQAVAFVVESGRVLGGGGALPWGRLETWVAEVHRRFPERFDHHATSATLWVAQGREFIREQVLEALHASEQPGSHMVFLRGDIEWRGARLPKDEAPALEHLLLEHARRCDETPKLLKQVGELGQIVVPVAQPPVKPSQKVRIEDDEWGSDDIVDASASGDWQDVRALWILADGETSAEELIRAAMLGRYRGLKAFATLSSRRFIRFVNQPPRPTGTPEVASMGAPVIPLPTAPRMPRRPEISTEYSVVRGNLSASRERISLPGGSPASSGPAFARVTRKYPLQTASQSASFRRLDRVAVPPCTELDEQVVDISGDAHEAANDPANDSTVELRVSRDAPVEESVPSASHAPSASDARHAHRLLIASVLVLLVAAALALAPLLLA